MLEAAFDKKGVSTSVRWGYVSERIVLKNVC